jgi:glycolate oxidase FAD binding subunit
MDNENEENKIITFIHNLDEIVFNSDGNFMIEKIPLKFKEKVSVWGRVNNNLKIVKKIKEQFDPQNIFNPNRFVGRI